MTIQNDTIVHAIIDVCYCQPPREWSTMGVHQHMSSHMQPVNYCYILEILSHILGVLARPRLHSRFSASRSGGFLDIPSKKGATAALRARTATITVRLSAANHLHQVPPFDFSPLCAAACGRNCRLCAVVAPTSRISSRPVQPAASLRVSQPKFGAGAVLRRSTPHAALIPCASGGCENTPQDSCVKNNSVVPKLMC